MYMQIFPQETDIKKIWKSVYVYQSYYQK